MRQRGPEATLFRSLLQNVRDGTVDYERDWKLIASRDLSLLPEEEKNEFNETAIKICAAGGVAALIAQMRRSRNDRVLQVSFTLL